MSDYSYSTDWKKLLDDDDVQKATERYMGQYNQYGQQAQQNIDAAYAPSVSYQKNLLSEVPAQYDASRRENDYNLQVAARKFQNQMAMEGQQNSGMSRSEQAGLIASHSKTAGEITSQQRNAEMEIRNAISQILAERDKAKADTALQYQMQGQEKADEYAQRAEERAYDSMWRLNDYQNNFDVMKEQDTYTRGQMQLDSDLTLKRDAVNQGYAQDNMRLQTDLNKEEASHSAGLEAQTYASKAAVDAHYSKDSAPSGSDYSDFIANGENLGKSLASQYMVKNEVTGAVTYPNESVRQSVAEMIFNRFFHATASYDSNGNTKIDYVSNFSGDDGGAALAAFDAAMSTAGLTEYSGYNGLAKLGAAQIRNRSLSH